MTSFFSFTHKYSRAIFILLVCLSLLPQVSPAIALFAGLVFAFTCGQAYPKFSKKMFQVPAANLGCRTRIRHESARLPASRKRGNALYHRIGRIGHGDRLADRQMDEDR